MALSRRMLKGMGLTEEQIDTIIEAHGETVTALKEERDQYKADAEKLPGIQKELETLKGGDTYKEQYEALKKQFDEFKDAQAKQAERSAVESAYRSMLREAGIPEKRIASILRVADLTGIKLDKDGAVKDKDKHMEALKSEWAEFIPTESVAGASTETPPATSTGAKTRAEIYKKDAHGRYILSAAERQKAIAESLSDK